MQSSHTQKLVLIYAILSLTFCILNTAAYQGLIPPDPQYKGQCVYHDELLKVGELVTKSSICQQLQCNKDGSILVTGCGRVRILNCNHGERLNMDKPYPACCVFKYKCKQADGTPYYLEKDTSKTATTTESTK